MFSVVGRVFPTAIMEWNALNLSDFARLVNPK